jgi:hypothetical protein
LFFYFPTEHFAESTNPSDDPLPQSSLTIKVEANEMAFVGEDVYFDASQSYGPSAGPLQFFWNFGDQTIASGSQVFHIYDKTGYFQVELLIRDGDNDFFYNFFIHIKEVGL